MDATTTTDETTTTTDASDATSRQLPLFRELGYPDITPLPEGARGRSGR